MRVPLPPEVDGPLVFKFELSEAEVKELSKGRCPERVSETCQGMLAWLAGEEAPDSVPAGSAVGSRELFTVVK